MKLLQQIILATDFSESSSKAADVAAMLARAFDSRITLVHVIREDQLSEEMESFLMDSVREKMGQLRSRIEKENVRVADAQIRKGIPFEEIIRVSRDLDANVIIVGEGASSGYGSSRPGTTVEKLMRKNQIPLWVVRKDAPVPISRILCPVDFSDASKRALSNAITLSRYFNATLKILHVYTPIRIDSPRLQVDEDRENERIRKERREEFARFIAQFDAGSVNAEPIFAEGEPHLKILDNIRELQADLLLMGTTGRTGLLRILMGSVTEKVTRELPCSFITTKATDITDNFLEENLGEIEAIQKAGNAAMDREEYDRSIEILTTGFRQYPDNIPIIKSLIASYKAAGKPEKATHFRKYAKEIVRRTWGEEYLDRIGL